jgi:hypothetical protein
MSGCEDVSGRRPGRLHMHACLPAENTEARCTRNLNAATFMENNGPPGGRIMGHPRPVPTWGGPDAGRFDVGRSASGDRSST